MKHVMIERGPRPHLKLPDGTALDGLRRDAAFHQLSRLCVPGIGPDMGKAEMLDAYERYLTARKGLSDG